MLRGQHTLEYIMMVFDVNKAAEIMSNEKFDYAEAGVHGESDTIEFQNGVITIEKGARLNSLREAPKIFLYRELAEGWTPASKVLPCFKRIRVTRKTVYDEWEYHEDIEEEEFDD